MYMLQTKPEVVNVNLNLKSTYLILELDFQKNMLIIKYFNVYNTSKTFFQFLII